MCIVLLALSQLTSTFYYIPQPGLAAVIFVSINSLVNFPDIWEVRLLCAAPYPLSHTSMRYRDLT